MIFTMFTFLLLLFVGAIMYYPCSLFSRKILDTMIYTYPDYFTGPWVEFFQAVLTYLLILAVLFPGLIWVYVQSQKPEGQVYA